MSFCQVMRGCGVPVALHTSSADWPTVTVSCSGSSTSIRGGTDQQQTPLNSGQQHQTNISKYITLEVSCHINIIYYYYYISIYQLFLPIFHFVRRRRRTISKTTRESRYQNVSILDFIGAKDDGSGDDKWGL